MHNDILNTDVTTIDGVTTTLEPWRGNVLLIVNVASKCGLTPQYEQLENIHKAWRDQGFAVLGLAHAHGHVGHGDRSRARGQAHGGQNAPDEEGRDQERTHQ